MDDLLKDQLELICAIMRWEPPVHLFGGFAEDAVLGGRARRAHVDIDLFVVRDELPLRIEQAEALGCAQLEVRFEPRPGLPLVIGGFVGDLNLELSVFDRTPDGRLSFIAPRDGVMTRVLLPEDTLDPQARTIEGVEVRTVSPLALYQIREGIEPTFGGKREKDIVAQAALRDAFFADAAEVDLVPPTEPLEQAARRRIPHVFERAPQDFCGPPPSGEATRPQTGKPSSLRTFRALAERGR